VQGKRIGERRGTMREEEGRSRERGQKGWRIDLTRREKSKQIEKNMKREGRNSKKRRGEDRKRHTPTQDMQ
jgi:hypothetical protein